MTTPHPTLHVIADLTELAGTERAMLRLVAALPHQPTLVVSLGGVSEAAYALAPGHARVVALGSSLTSPVAGTVGLARLLRRQRPAALVSWMYRANLTAALAAQLARFGGPLLWNIRHAWPSGAHESVGTRLAARAGTVLAGQVKHVIFNSERACAEHVRHGYPAHNAVVIRNGVTPPALPLPPSRPPAVVGVAARFHPHKDFKTLLGTLRRVAHDRPQLTVVMCGHGVTAANPVLSAFRDAIGAERVRLLGYVADMSTFYRSVDVLLLSSVTESLPNVLIEAMAHGVPCITTDAGDAAALVAGSGHVVPVGDQRALAEAVLRVLAEPVPDFERRRAAARERVDDAFTMRHVSEAYEALLAL